MSDRLLQDTIGAAGAAAVERAVAARPALVAALRPRAALAWARLAIERGYAGAVPGAGDATLLVKGELWTVDVPGGRLEGGGAFGLAALLVALAGGRGEDRLPASRAATRLGRSMDTLAKAAWCAPAGGSVPGRYALKKAAKPKTDAPGPAAKPIAPAPPDPPAPPAAAQRGVVPVAPRPPKAPRAAGAVLRRSELQRPCGECGTPQLENGALVGCGCWSELCKSLVWRETAAGYVVRFPEDDRDGAVAFLAALRGGDRVR